MFWKRIAYYLDPRNLFRKEANSDVSLRMMHGVNKISIWMFLFCLTVLVIRWISRS
jgi:hypothetical protein